MEALAEDRAITKQWMELSGFQRIQPFSKDNACLLGNHKHALWEDLPSQDLCPCLQINPLQQKHWPVKAEGCSGRQKGISVSECQICPFFLMHIWTVCYCVLNCFSLKILQYLNHQLIVSNPPKASVLSQLLVLRRLTFSWSVSVIFPSL